MLPLFTQSHIIALLPSNEKSFTLYDGFGKSALIWSFKPRNLSGEKFTYGMAVVFKKCYFIWLRGTKEGQECASIRHFEIFSMSSVLEMSTKPRVVNDSITSNCNSTRAGSDSDSDSRVFQNR